jgi:glycerol uptake facilitator-like aquaporin
MASAGKLNINELLPYIIAQVLGGLTALQVYKRFQM